MSGLHIQFLTPVIVIATYAPKEQRSNDHPEEREKYYCELEQILNKIPNRDFIVIAGDVLQKQPNSNLHLHHSCTTQSGAYTTTPFCDIL